MIVHSGQLVFVAHGMNATGVKLFESVELNSSV
jgi:hypothetical protein